MGYTTEFVGEFKLDKLLSKEHKEYLLKFSSTRRMSRHADILSTMVDDVRNAAGLPLGKQGGYFVGAKGWAGQDQCKSIIDYNNPPFGQPGLWCQWIPNDEGSAIEWDGNEKFYSYIEWIEYIAEHFLGPWGYKLNGVMDWMGEDPNDTGHIFIKDNKVTVK
jgi:hypothetical protein